MTTPLPASADPPTPDDIELTDDGLAAVAARMPVLPPSVACGPTPADPPPPGAGDADYDVRADGTDPCAGLGVPG